jgi:peptidoglycan/LPS O-acetylase OafA/YrhL
MQNPSQSIHLTPAKRHRFLLLDALRGLAALFVVAWHLPGSFRTFLCDSNGLLAVDFFFCLSGFVIAFSYETRLAEGLSMKAFFVARIIRLYPIYLLGSLLGFLATVLHGSGYPLSIWLTLCSLGLVMLPAFLLRGGNTANFPFDGPAWSLFYELVANFAFALLIKFRAAGDLVFVFLCLLSIFFLGDSIWHGGTIDVGYSGATSALGFARVGFSFSAGVLMQRRHRIRVLSIAHDGTRWFTAAIVTVCLTFILMSPWKFMQSEIFRLIAIVIFFPAMVYHGAFARLPHRFTNVCATLGDISYPLYLLHRPLIGPLYSITIARVSQTHPSIVHLSLPLILLILTLIARWVAIHLDAPVRRYLTQRFNSFRKASAAESRVVIEQ